MLCVSTWYLILNTKAHWLTAHYPLRHKQHHLVIFKYQTFTERKIQQRLNVVISVLLARRVFDIKYSRHRGLSERRNIKWMSKYLLENFLFVGHNSLTRWFEMLPLLCRHHRYPIMRVNINFWKMSLSCPMCSADKSSWRKKVSIVVLDAL